MPSFSSREFEAACAQLTTDELLKEHKHYAKMSSGSMASTAVSALSIPFTFGLSAVAISSSAPAHSNAKKKKQSIEKLLKARGIDGQQGIQCANFVAAQEAQKDTLTREQLRQSWGNPYAALSTGNSLGTSTLERKADYIDDKKGMKKSEKCAMPLHSNPPGKTSKSSSSSPAQSDGSSSPEGRAELKPASSRRGKRQTGYYPPAQLASVTSLLQEDDDSPTASPDGACAPQTAGVILQVAVQAQPRLRTGGIGAHSNLYPHSCIWSGPHGSDVRQVHFAPGVEYIS